MPTSLDLIAQFFTRTVATPDIGCIYPPRTPVAYELWLGVRGPYGCYCSGHMTGGERCFPSPSQWHTHWLEKMRGCITILHVVIRCLWHFEAAAVQEPLITQKKIASTATSRCSISGASEKTQLKMPHGSCFLVQILLMVPGPFFSPVKSNLWRCSHVTSKIPRSFDLFILYLQIIR